MSFFVYHRDGACERDPGPSVFAALLDEIAVSSDDQEHPSVSVVHESEWALGLHTGGYVIYENVEEEDQPRHMRDVSREKAMEMMQSLAKGDLEALDNEPWQAGN